MSNLNLPRCSDPHCLMDGFLLLNGRPYCREHYTARGGIL